MIARQPFVSESEIVRKIKGILEAIRSPEHADEIIELQRIYKKNVPLFERSYFATFLLKEALKRGDFSTGPERSDRKGKSRENMGDRPQRSERQEKEQVRRQEAVRLNQSQKQGQSRDSREKEERADRRLEENRSPQPRNLPLPEGVESSTLFVSAGRKRHFYPRHFLDLLDENGITRDSIGEIRLFDNYTFVQVRAEAAPEIIQKLDGISFKGRRLTVNPARKREDDTGSTTEETSALRDRADEDVLMDRPTGEDGMEDSGSLLDGVSGAANDAMEEEPDDDHVIDGSNDRPAGLGTGGYETDYASEEEVDGDFTDEDMPSDDDEVIS